VKALMDVNLDMSGSHVKKYYTPAESYNLAAEVNARYLEENKEDDLSHQAPERSRAGNAGMQSARKVNQPAGFLSLLGRKVKRFLSRILRNRSQ